MSNWIEIPRYTTYDGAAVKMGAVNLDGMHEIEDCGEWRSLRRFTDPYVALIRTTLPYAELLRLAGARPCRPTDAERALADLCGRVAVIRKVLRDRDLTPSAALTAIENVLGGAE